VNGDYPSTQLFESDNTGYHDYRLAGDFTTSTWSFYRDDILIGSGGMMPYLSPDSLVSFGDLSGGGNANGDWLSVQVNSSVPEPASLSLLLLGSLGLLGRRRWNK